MISTPQNWSDWRRLSSDTYVSKRHFFHFFTIHVKCCSWGLSALLVNGSVCYPTNLPIDTYRQTHKKRTAPIDTILSPERENDNYRLSSLSIYSSKLYLSWSKNNVREPARVFILWKLLCMSFSETRNKIWNTLLIFRMPIFP